MQGNETRSVIVRCPECRSKYEIAAPEALDPLVKVRCPQCKAVFSIRGGGYSAATGSKPELATVKISRSVRPRITDPVLARRLARAMISEIVLNRREESEEARGEGALLSHFGPALVSAYDVYRAKVSPELVSAPRIFRDAVNDVLGGGERLL